MVGTIIIIIKKVGQIINTIITLEEDITVGGIKEDTVMKDIIVSITDKEEISLDRADIKAIGNFKMGILAVVGSFGCMGTLDSVVEGINFLGYYYYT